MNKDFEKDSGAIIDDAAGSPSTGLPGGTSPETYGVMPLASTAVGKVLEVYASKTRAEALSLTGVVLPHGRGEHRVWREGVRGGTLLHTLGINRRA